MRKKNPTHLFSKMYPLLEKNLESYEPGIIGESLGGTSSSSFVAGIEEADLAVQELISEDILKRMKELGKSGRPDHIAIKNYLESMLLEWKGEE